MNQQHNENNQIETVFSDFLSLQQFKVCDNIKKKILKELLEALPFPWKIIGITPNALSLLKEHDFDKKDKKTKKSLPIQRAHLKHRDKWYQELLDKQWNDHTDWYSFIQDNDKTVLALSSENNKINEIDYFPLIDSDGLFHSTRISWRHGKAEKEYLKKLSSIL